jgi:hypothetical protein
MLRVPRRARKSLLVLSALLMVLTVAQFGLGASPAFADRDENKCGQPMWSTREIVTGTGLNIIERCEPITEYFDPTTRETVTEWDWVHYKFKTATNNQRTLWQSGCASPGYIMVMSDLMSNGSGGGAAAAKVLLYDCNGDQLSRTTGARVVTQYNRPDGWYTCNDSGWKQTTNGRVAAYINQYTQPDCGNGSYRALAAGRFWSVTRNSWITRGWIATPAISLSYSCCTTEPEVTPTPTPATPE